MEDIKITLETLYDLLRNEKKREDLQKLEETFFLDVVTYLREKKGLLALKKEESNVFASGERDKIDYELRSIQRILKELYEKREKKIIDIALNKSKTGSDIIDTSAMLKEEKEFYQQVLTILDTFRKGILFQLFQTELPSIQPIPKTLETRKQEIREELEQGPSARVNTMVDSVVNPVVNKMTNVMAKVRFTHAVPSFVWKDLKIYGPFRQGEETDIFPEVAELLVRKGRAEKV